MRILPKNRSFAINRELREEIKSRWDLTTKNDDVFTTKFRSVDGTGSAPLLVQIKPEKDCGAMVELASENV